ncbi:MAG: chemotaxis protein CheW [Nitrospinota bacterium]
MEGVVPAELHENRVGSAEKSKFCTLWLSGRLFGLNILDVKEIHPIVEFTPIFHAPEGVKGYVNIRGQIYLILDLSIIMGLKKGEEEKGTHLVIFKPSVGPPFGIVADRVGDVVEVDNREIVEPSLDEEGGVDVSWDKTLLCGVSRLKDHLLVLLDGRGILKTVKSLGEN